MAPATCFAVPTSLATRALEIADNRVSYTLLAVNSLKLANLALGDERSTIIRAAAEWCSQ